MNYINIISEKMYSLFMHMSGMYMIGLIIQFRT